MFSNFITPHINSYTTWLTIPPLCKDLPGLQSGFVQNWNTFTKLEAKFNLIRVKIEVAFCSLKQKTLYILHTLDFVVDKKGHSYQDSVCVPSWLWGHQQMPAINFYVYADPLCPLHLRFSFRGGQSWENRWPGSQASSPRPLLCMAWFLATAVLTRGSMSLFSLTSG